MRARGKSPSGTANSHDSKVKQLGRVSASAGGTARHPWPGLSLYQAYRPARITGKPRRVEFAIVKECGKARGCSLDLLRGLP
jgi:hypothetical protein